MIVSRKKRLFIGIFLIAWILVPAISAFAEIIQYSYDDMDRLIRAEYEDGTVIVYTYDKADNRLTKIITATSSSFFEDFEHGGALPDGWENASGDDLDWTVHAGATPSGSTGPSADHTLGTTAGYYLYVEASGNYPEKTAQLLTPVIDLSAVTSPTLGFWYHMYGIEMGELHVDVYAEGVWHEDVMPPLSGNQGNTWWVQWVDLSAYTGSIRIRFRGVTGSGYRSDIAIDDVSVSEAPPTIATFPYHESFEQGGALPDGWEQASGDDLDWTVYAGATPSGSTGPSADHTLGTAAGYYLYVEASGNYPEKTAQLLTPFIDLSAVTSPTLGFWYHMYGIEMGKLHVDVYAEGTWHEDVMPPLAGDRGDAWWEQRVDLSAYTGRIRIRFRGVTGSGYRSDLAIDDVSVFEAPPAIATFPHIETFEQDGALPDGWINAQGNDVDWLVDASGTPSGSTGPSADHTLGTVAGYYLYVEASGNYPEKTAQLLTPVLDLSAVPGLTLGFWYHMYGTTMGELHVDVYAEGVWHEDVMPPLTGDQGDMWQERWVDLSAYTGSIRIRFRGVTGSGFQSDLAIDDVSFWEAPPPIVTFPYTETFEQGGALPAGWINAQGNDVDWIADAGGTPTGSTGPSVDHTLGTAEGYYVYVEASGNYPEKTAQLLTPFLDLSAVTSPTLGFWYHLYGATMGELHVDVYTEGTWHEDVMPPLSGNRENMWREQRVDLSAYTGRIRIRFRGVTGSSYASDLAIDDISVFEAPSAMTTFPYTETFEQGGGLPAGWLNAHGGDVDWMVDANGTPTGSTGPSVDHTLGTTAGYYLYVEASGNYPDKTAQLLSPVIDLSALTSPTLDFWYHLYGSTMGTLHVDVYAGGIWYVDVMPPLSGNHGDMWLEHQVDLSAYTGNIRIRFRGVTGASYSSDLAIDDVSIFEPSMSSLMSSPLVTIQKEGAGDGTIRVGAQECGEGCEALQVPYADYALLTVIAADGSHFVRLEREDGTPLNLDSFEVSPGETVFVIFEQNE